MPDLQSDPRQFHDEGGEGGPGFKVEDSAVALDDAFGDRKSKAGALADFLGGEKRQHDLLGQFPRDARSGINDANHDLALIRRDFEFDPIATEELSRSCLAQDGKREFDQIKRMESYLH